jgi:hypothetical protein
MEKEMPIYLEKSKLVLARIWRTSLDDDERPYFQSLIDQTKLAIHFISVQYAAGHF